MRRILIFLSLFSVFAFGIKGGFDDSFYRLKTEQRKNVFINQMDILFDEAFKKIMQERAYIDHIFKSYAKSGFRNLSAEEFKKLTDLQKKYRIKNLFDYEEYKKRIATVPKSMGIAQAMIESGTGTSRFAREANNLFGHYTFTGKGLIPRQRIEGKTHKIRIFNSLQESVDAYLLNLNSHGAYEDFRRLRAKYEKENKKFTGLDAVHTLENYSEIKARYAKILEHVIKNNNLSRFD